MWFKVDDGLAFHHKTVKAGNAAMGLWVRAGSWCGAQMTDGFVPDEILAVMGTPAQVARLVSAGLWVPVDGGCQFHGWGEWQPAKVDVQAARKKEAARKKLWRETRVIEQANSQDTAGQATVSRVNSTGQDAGQTADKTRDTGSGRVGSSRSTGSREVTARESRASRATRIPTDFSVTPDMVEWKQKNAPRVDGRRETEKFVNYWKAKSGSDATKVDWVATWRNWMLRADERPHPNGTGSLDNLWEDR